MVIKRLEIVAIKVIITIIEVILVIVIVRVIIGAEREPHRMYVEDWLFEAQMRVACSDFFVASILNK